jgi:hypothetical protein
MLKWVFEELKWAEVFEAGVSYGGCDCEGLERAQSGTDASGWVSKITEPTGELGDATQSGLMTACVTD